MLNGTPHSLRAVQITRVAHREDETLVGPLVEDEGSSNPTWSTAWNTGPAWGSGTNNNASWTTPDTPSKSTSNPWANSLAPVSPQRPGSPVPKWGTPTWGTAVETGGGGWGSSAKWGVTVDASDGWRNAVASETATGTEPGWSDSPGTGIEPTNWTSADALEPVPKPSDSPSTAAGPSAAPAPWSSNPWQSSVRDSPRPGSPVPRWDPTSWSATVKTGGDYTTEAGASVSGDRDNAKSSVVNQATSWNTGDDWNMDIVPTETDLVPIPAASTSTGGAGDDAVASWSAVHAGDRAAEHQPPAAVADSDWPMTDETLRPATLAEKKPDMQAAPDKPRDSQERTKAHSRTSSRHTTPMDVRRPLRLRSISPDVQGSPVKAVRALAQAVLSYVEWENAKQALARSKSLSKVRKYAHACPLAQEKIKQDLKHHEKGFVRAQKHRNDALRALALQSSCFELSDQSEVAGRTNSLERFERYAAEVKAWLEDVRPLVEPRRLQHPSAGKTLNATASTSDTRFPAQRADAQLIQFLRDATDRIDQMDVRVRELEAYQEGLRTAAQESVNRAGTVAGSLPTPRSHALGETVPPEQLQTQEVEIAKTQSQLAMRQAEVAEVSQRGQVTLVDLQQLRVEQEQLRMRITELKASDNAVRQDFDKLSSTLSSLKSIIADLHQRPCTSKTVAPAPVPPPPAFTYDEIVIALLPELSKASREDLDMGLEQLRGGFESATAQQTRQLNDAVWKQLQPILSVARLIQNDEMADGSSDVEFALSQISTIALV
ncbi:uncharacterized protein PHACADRAFT_195527 [Phanerochaete carnosa HHB-10118-sp]|uniref:Uncharacterized protein n=1 Tax=Phanerochaete carnosa (strain HHB-10118-sp) TaxID=650164 RepID=K5VVD9_PHACS|nr:uncharacterized protein PHACADRAFT_195527 [Phanerochaete carnosa HHB-10118-sp]EKM55493.1 hypothetical protein PHACADRAFT_195527 [Phanerochaete carnosa HHB-10118-sp]